jgi:alcohol dehydrogenase/propanol-preferring alcohol dehydrogenase
LQLEEIVDVERSMRSCKLETFGAPLAEIIESPPSPSGSQVLVRVRACGVCHSDIHLSDGSFDLGRGRSQDLSKLLPLPLVLGHEIAGVVEELGPEAAGVSVGDRVAVYAWGGCGRCAQCRAGRENLCAEPDNLGIRRNGGFSNYVLVEHPRHLVAFDPLPEAFAATLGCSGLTAYSALNKVAPIDAEHPLLIIGAGGLGLSAVQMTRALHGVGAVVADIDPVKREAAVAAGAAEAVDPADPAVRERLLKGGGFASAIDFVGAETTVRFGMGLLRKGGQICVVGLYGGAMELPLVWLPSRAISLSGVYVGSLTEFRELIALAGAGHIKPLPMESRPLSEAQHSLDDLRAGRVRGRIVLTP